MSKKLTTEEILDRLRTIHPNLDFSKSQPTSINCIITVICPVHGEFEKNTFKMFFKPYQGCRQCGFARRNKDREITVEKLKAAVLKNFGGSIDPSGVTELPDGVHSKITCICKKHGPTLMSAGKLYRGESGCPKCGREKGKEAYKPEDIKRIIEEKHPGRFDLDTLIYTSMKDSITINCKKHGKIVTSAGTLLRDNKQGCKKCNKEAMYSKIQSDTHNDYVQRLAKKYGDEYDLSKVKYVNRTTPLIVGCKKHGWFEIDPWAFLSGRGGCSYCSGKYLCNDDFKARIDEIHGAGRYTCDLVQTTKHKFGVTCNKCGNKWMAYSTHLLAGRGCPTCAKSGFHPTEPAILYLIEFKLSSGVLIYKVGITNNTTLERLMNMRVHPSVSYRVLKEVKFEVGRDAYTEEKRIHDEFDDYRYLGKKFLKNGWTELFVVNPFTYAKNSI